MFTIFTDHDVTLSFIFKLNPMMHRNIMQIPFCYDDDDDDHDDDNEHTCWCADCTHVIARAGETLKHYIQ